MRSRRRRSVRPLALVLTLEAVVILAILGVLQLRRQEVEPPGAEVDTRPRLAGVSVRGVIPDDLARASPWLDDGWLEARILDAAREEGSLAVAVEPGGEQEADEQTRFRLEARVVLSEQSSPAVGGSGLPPTLEKAAVSVALLSLTTGAEPPRRFEGKGTAERSSKDGTAEAVRAAVREAVTASAKDALGLALVGALAQAKPVGELIADLESDERVVQVAALRALGQRKERTAREAVEATLEADDHDVVLAAVGTLVALRSPQSVPALIESTRGRSRDYLRQVLFALASIGGPEADAYLDTLVVGHQNARVRALASEALAELRRARRSGPDAGGARAEPAAGSAGPGPPAP